jgi:perosamine synthetase
MKIKKLNQTNVPLYEPILGNLEKKYVKNCLDTNWISSKGKYVKLFENKFKNFIKTKYAVSICNGTAALHVALLALGITKKDEVITPTFTYIATANSINYVGASVKFVDSKISSWQIDEDKILKSISSRTKAILIPHIYGQTCEMIKIKKICKKNKLFLIEDCAEAFGSYYKNKHVGTFGDVSTFSFFGSKTITTGEGGMVVTNNYKIAKKAEELKMVGNDKDKYYWHNIIGYNYRMTNICAAIGLGQISRAKQILLKKRSIFKIYQKNLKNLPLYLHEEQSGTTHSYWMISIRLINYRLRDKLRDHLNKLKIETRPTFYPIHTMPMYFKKVNKNKFPNATLLGRSGINLPSGPTLKINQIQYVCDEIRNFLNRY